MIRESMVGMCALVVLAAGGCAAGASYPHKVPVSDAELIANAMSAAPEAVAKAATVMAIDAKGQTRVLRQGPGPFTCLPDNPESPGNDPMCVDKAGLEWAKAWMSKTTPQPGMVGFGYMLMGGSDASNDDPYAKGPAPGKRWVETGPHVMIFNPGPMIDAYPKSAKDPRQPYVMWGDTPYRHLMIPVR